MKIRAKINFRDKYTGDRYEAGREYEVKAERGAEIIAAQGGKFAEEVQAQEPEKTAENENLAVDDEAPAFHATEAMLIDDLTVAELRDMAKVHQIEGYTKMKKAELIKALRSEPCDGE